MHCAMKYNSNSNYLIGKKNSEMKYIFSCSPTSYYLSSIYFLQVSSFIFVVPSFFVIPGATVVSISNPRTKSSSGQNNGYIYFPPKYQNRNPLFQSISFSTLADSTTSTSSAVTYRSAENKDLKTVSNLVCDNLYRNSRTGWFIDKFIRIYRELDTQQALNHRMMSYMSSSDRKVTGESYRQHNMFVAVGVKSSENDQEDEQLINAPENDDMEKLIGFIEIGQVKMQSLIPDRQNNLVPHIGNLVVADGFRRQGVGLGLMTVACQTAKSWGYPAVYCGVHSTNSAAIELYTRKLDFQIIHSKVSDKGEIDYVLEKLLS